MSKNDWNDKEFVKLYKHQYYLNHREKMNIQMFNAHYGFLGINFDDKIRLFEEQKGKCKLCKDKIEVFSAHLDHCHEKNIVRGLLCSRCNKGLGQFKHSQKRLRAAIRFLNLFK